MRLTKDTIIRRNALLIVKKIDKTCIIFDVSKGNLYKMNESAEVIWKFLWKQRSVEQIINKISSQFSVEKKKVEKEAKYFLTEHLGQLFTVLEK